MGSAYRIFVLKRHLSYASIKSKRVQPGGAFGEMGFPRLKRRIVGQQRGSTGKVKVTFIESLVVMLVRYASLIRSMGEFSQVVPLTRWYFLKRRVVGQQRDSADKKSR